jgi:hypothetical protein
MRNTLGYRYWPGTRCQADQNVREGQDKMMVGGEDKNREAHHLTAITDQLATRIWACDELAPRPDKLAQTSDELALANDKDPPSPDELAHPT